MGSKVIFSRAPRGDATQAPPPIGASSQLGTSDRAAREDHTHEGVHRIAVGDGLGVSPTTGLGDVTLTVRHWRPPVQQATQLPPVGNEPGDARVVLAEASIYVWTGTTWQRITSAGGGNGGGGDGGPGFDAWGALNRLHLGLEQVEFQQRPALTAYSERYDALVDDSGIDWTRSANVELRDGRIVAKPSQWVGFGDDWVRVPGPVRHEESLIDVSLAPGSFEYGLTSVVGAWGHDTCIAGVVTPTPTESTRTVRVVERVAEPPRFVPLSPGGFDYGVQSVIDVWGRTGSFEPGLADAIAPRREVVQFTTGPGTQVQAADGTFEAGITSVIQRSIRRGGSPVVVSQPIYVPAAPRRAYLVARAERARFWVSRDDGVTWTPIEQEGVAEVAMLPTGNRLRVQAELQDEMRSYVEAWAYGAAQ